MGSRGTLFGWITLGVIVVATTSALAYTLVRLGDVSDEAKDLKGRLLQVRDKLAALEDKPGAATFDWRSLVRRVERLEGTDKNAPATVASGARTVGPQTAGAARLSGVTSSLDAPADLPPHLPTKLLATEPFRNGLQEMLKTGTKKMFEERRAEWRKKWDERFQQDIQSFAKSQGLNETQTQSMAAIVQDDRDQRREIKRQVRGGELDTPTAKKQIDTLNTNTKARIVESVGEPGYQAYQQHKQEQRQLRRSLRRF